MPEHIVEAIENYLDHGLKGSAILVNGPWGTGKTHYMRHILPSIAEARDMDVIWISLYGLEYAKEVVELVAMGRMGKSKGHSTIKQQIKTLAKEVSQVFGSKISSASSVAISMYGRVIRKKTILVVDDLERISSKADLSSVLGVIQTVYGENPFVDVICIGSESDILDSEKYYKSKEKVISHTVFYEDISTAIESICKNVLKDVNMSISLIECVDELKLYMNSLGLHNLRTMTLSLKAFKYFNEHFGRLSAKMERTILYALICTYKFLSELEKGELEKPADVYVAFSKPLHKPVFKKSELHEKLHSLIVGGLGYQAKRGDIFNKYLDIEVFDSLNIVNYCRFLNCDLELLKTELDSLQVKIDRSTSSLMIQVIKKMQSAVWLTDEDFDRYIGQFFELLPLSDFLETVSAASLVAQYEKFYPDSGVDFRMLKGELLSLIDSSSTASIDHIHNLESLLNRDIERINKREPEVAQAIRNRIAIYRKDREQVLIRTSWFEEFESISRSNLCMGLSTLGERKLRAWYDKNLGDRSRMDKIATFLDKELPYLVKDLSVESKDGFDKLEKLLSSLEQSESYGYISKYWLRLHLKFLRAAMGTSS